ncbi:hypothetical protein QCA50_016778 [Cerrena zonata]|uniref:beta-N-acetylhexosaminidase n=1 Tax=Cerrena zonata TaxID=2478898 RepID=A0AAW0FRW9_9APHY
MFAYLLLLFSLVDLSQSLWPIPRQLTTGSIPLKLSRNFDVVVNIHSAPQDLLDSISRTNGHLKNDSFERLVVGRSAADTHLVNHAASLDSLVVSLSEGSIVRSVAAEITEAIESRSESYTLSIPNRGQARLTANSTLGLFRGLATFEQLWYTLDQEKYLTSAPIEIVDEPAFPYRSFSLDTARNFYPVSDILRTLDAMSWVKMSTLYWHVADSQSFPLSIPAFPELASKGAYSQEEIYSVDDVKEIVHYANTRGIDVVMELDTPGHTTAIGSAHPEHVACPNKSPWSKYANEPPAGQLRIASDATVEFTKQVFKSVLSMMTSPLMSTGGDEVNLPCWEEDEETMADLEEKNITIGEALNEFVVAIQGVLKENGKIPFIKSDMILTHNVPVTNDTVAVVWQSSADAVGIAERGLRFIHQPSNYFYLDCGAGDWVGNNVLGNSWCDPFKTWQRVKYGTSSRYYLNHFRLGVFL